MEDITHEELLENFSYDPDKGILMWRKKGAGRQMKKPLGCPNNKGYLQVVFMRKKYLVHRVAWFYCTGIWPQNTLDHINGDYTDNRICNLRQATLSQNCCNRKSRSPHGFKGITKRPNGKWHAAIRVNRKAIHLGVFGSPEEAHEAYKKAAIEFHGEFARF